MLRDAKYDKKLVGQSALVYEKFSYLEWKMFVCSLYLKSFCVLTEALSSRSKYQQTFSTANLATAAVCVCVHVHVRKIGGAEGGREREGETKQSKRWREILSPFL